MKKLLFVCVIAASFTACNNGTGTETKVDSTVVTKIDSSATIVAPVDTTSKKIDSAAKKLDTAAKKMDKMEKKMDTAAKH